MIHFYMEVLDLSFYTITSLAILLSFYSELWDLYPVNNDLDSVIEGPVSINR